MASAADPHSVLYKGGPVTFRPKRANQVKVQRYFAGVIPDFKPSNEEEIIEEPQIQVAVPANNFQHEKLDIDALDDRVPGTESHRKRPSTESFAEQRRRRRLAALDAQEGDLAKDDEVDDHLFGDTQEEFGEVPPELTAEADVIVQPTEAGGETSSSSDTEEEEVCLARPVFVPTKQRKEREEALQRLAAEKQQAEADVERRQTARLLLIQSLEQAEAAEKERQLLLNETSHLEPRDMPPDDDHDDEEEYAKWRDRELVRLRRTATEKNAREEFEEALKSRRLMTETERKADDERLDALKPKEAPKSKYTFLQKYYHKGVFYQDLARDGKEELYLRDFNAPLVEETVDKSALPKPMQLRRGQWGQKGQVKHTHLADVDTTDNQSAWSQIFRKKKNEKRDRVI